MGRSEPSISPRPTLQDRLRSESECRLCLRAAEPRAWGRATPQLSARMARQCRRDREIDRAEVLYRLAGRQARRAGRQMRTDHAVAGGGAETQKAELTLSCRDRLQR